MLNSMSNKELHFVTKKQRCKIVGYDTEIGWKELPFDSNEPNSPIMPTNFNCTALKKCPDHHKCPYSAKSFKDFVILQNRETGEHIFIHRPTKKYIMWPSGKRGIWTESL